MADWHVGPLGYAKIHLNRCTGWESGPQNIENFHFLVNDRHRGQTPDRFLKVLGDFMRTISLQKCFKFDVIRFAGYGVFLRNRASLI